MKYINYIRMQIAWHLGGLKWDVEIHSSMNNSRRYWFLVGHPKQYKLKFNSKGTTADIYYKDKNDLEFK